MFETAKLSRIIPAGLFLLLASSGSAQQSRIDSLANLVKTGKRDTNLVNSMILLCKDYHMAGDDEKGNTCVQEALILSEKLNYRKGIASSYGFMANVCSDRGDFPKALKYNLTALNIRKEIADKKGIASSYNNIGNIYHHQGDHTKSLEYHLSSLKIKEEIGDKRGVAMSYLNMGNVYHKQRNFTKSLKNYEAALKGFEEVGDKKSIPFAYASIGNVFLDLGNLEKSLEYSLISLKKSEEIGDKFGVASMNSNIGNIYNELGKYGKALEYYNLALRLNEEIGNIKGSGNTHSNIGELYLAQNNITEAKKHQLLALKIAKDIGVKDQLMIAYEKLSMCDSAAGNFKGAYTYHKLYKQVSDSLFNDENTENIARMSEQYESEKKDNEIKLLNKDKEKQAAITEANSKKQKVITASVSGGLLLVLVFSVFMYRRWRVTQQQKLIIEDQKELVEEKQKEILDSIRYAKRIQTSLLPTEKYIERKMNDLKK